jgi:uncharacterized protein (TIGR00290 family)
MNTVTNKKPIPAVFCWSGGKDSSYALHKIITEGVYEVKYLLSTFNGVYNRLSMHGVREELIAAQAKSIGLPLLKVYVYEADNAEYERQMNATLQIIKEQGINTLIYGDIFLEDLRQYRENKMAAIEMQCVFPIWQVNTAWMVNDFVQQGFQSVICCINDGYLDASWAGRIINTAFIADLPNIVDPCGENGEFHSFCFDGPVFKTPIPITIGEKIYKPLLIKTTDHPTPIKDVGTKGFWFCDLLPANNNL